MDQPRRGDSMVERMFMIKVAYSLSLGEGRGRAFFSRQETRDGEPLVRKRGVGGIRRWINGL